MSSLSRAELEDMDRDELVETVLELDRRLADVEAEVETVRQGAGAGRAEIRARRQEIVDGIYAEIEEVRDDLRRTEQRVNHRRAKVTRRLSNIEDELGFEDQDILALAEGGADALRESKLARLMDGGPEAISDNPTATLYRTEILARNWIRWGRTEKNRDGEVVERTLATRRDDLRTHLEDKEEGPLHWRQVYRAMRKVAELGPANIRLQDDSSWGKTLVQDVGGEGNRQ